MLKADKKNGNIRLDSETQLTGVTAEAWTYKLGNRSGARMDSRPVQGKDAEGPNHPREVQHLPLRDYKEKVIDLLKRVTRVSIETMKIVEAMRQMDRDRL